MITLTITFVILAALLLWLCIDRKGSKIIKALMIPVVIWFGLVLFYTPSRIMGWPVEVTYDGMPDMGVVLSWKVIEPSINASEAGIYLWIVPKRFGEPEKSLFEIIVLDPRYAFAFTLKDTPRCYKLPYEKSEHEALSKRATKASKLRGLLMFRKDGGRWGDKKKDGKDPDDQSKWRILDPQEILKKTHKIEGG